MSYLEGKIRPFSAWLFLGLAFATFFVFLSQVIHWSDSELWAIGLSQEVFSAVNSSTAYKFFFNLVLRGSYLFAGNDLAVVNHARIIFAAFGIFVLSGATVLGAKMTGRAVGGVATFFVFATCSLFLSQGFKVRSDLLATVMQVAGLGYFFWLCKTKSSTADLNLKEVVIGVTLNCLVLLATPKGVYQLGALFVFAVFTQRQFQSSWIRKYLLTAFGLPVVFGAFAVIAFWAQFQTALDFFLRSYQESPQHPAFWQLRSFEFVFDAVLRNLTVFILCLGAVGSVFIGRNRSNLWLKPVAAAAMASILLIVLHNDRLPFFLMSQMLFPLLLAGVYLSEIRSVKARVLFFVAASLSAVVFVFQMTENAANADQVAAQSLMAQYLDRHGDPFYYDATSVLPLKNKIFVFPAPQHPGNESEVLQILDRPELQLVFFGNRLYYYLQPFYLKLEERFFISIGPGVFARSYAMRGTHEVTPSEWNLICKDFALQGRLHAYAGSNFLTMHLAQEETLNCAEPFKKLKTTEPFIAFTAYAPLVFNKGSSFSKIFDHKPYY